MATRREAPPAAISRVRAARTRTPPFDLGPGTGRGVRDPGRQGRAGRRRARPPQHRHAHPPRRRLVGQLHGGARLVQGPLQARHLRRCRPGSRPGADRNAPGPSRHLTVEVVDGPILWSRRRFMVSAPPARRCRWSDVPELLQGHAQALESVAHPALHGGLHGADRRGDLRERHLHHLAHQEHLALLTGSAATAASMRSARLLADASRSVPCPGAGIRSIAAAPPSPRCAR